LSKDPSDHVIFVTLVSSEDEQRRARLLIDSIRSFGGPLRRQPIWLFESHPRSAPSDDLEREGVRVLPLLIPDLAKNHPLAGKVLACAQAEELAGPEIQSLVWLSSDCLIIQPPVLFSLAPACDAVLRPVHTRNVGLLADEPIDGFWKKVYETLGVKDIEVTLESFVDRARIRAYYNSHAFAVDPSRGLLRGWLHYFETLVSDREFQSGPCKDMRHRIFLHQAVLSALITVLLDSERVRILPADYIYPYNLHQSVPPDRRATALNDLVCIACEDRTLDPSVVNDIRIDEPLRSWLSTRQP